MYKYRCMSWPNSDFFYFYFLIYLSGKPRLTQWVSTESKWLDSDTRDPLTAKESACNGENTVRAVDCVCFKAERTHSERDSVQNSMK